MASALQPEAKSDRCLRHLTRQSPSGKPWHRKGPAVSGKDPKEQRLKGRFTEIRPVCPACSAPQRRKSASAQARGLPRGKRAIGLGGEGVIGALGVVGTPGSKDGKMAALGPPARTLRGLLRELRYMSAGTGRPYRDTAAYRYLVQAFRAHRVTSEKLCRAQHELHFQAATYLCLLRSVREHVALHQEFHGRGERSVEEAAGLQELQQELVFSSFAWAVLEQSDWICS
ncbi:LOW QUALITY PROTEIN: hypothetical protein QTO34_004674 [Cnephaeus nilssonii]|uniref:Protein FMC1 homolog n=1 Tax=Cnephaeus nilssonii TaxID=3371016 RepID=A0AA40HPP5_CNENI|nr:LOW QUALITY PROTEIN: hypothetical protein QTO34_004674 [Eptesicus nilssonii]